jgi:hypothetical protein
VLQTLNFNVRVLSSMLQTCDVGICVEDGSRAPDVGCCTQHGSQHGSLGCCVRGEEGRDPLMFGCCTQHVRNMARNMLATWVAALFDLTADGLSCFKSNGHDGIRC